MLNQKLQYSYFEDVNLSRYGLLGRVIYVLQSFAALWGTHRFGFILSLLGVISFSLALTHLLFNSLPVVLGVFVFIAITAFFLAAWMHIGAQLAMHFKMTLVTGFRDASLFFAPFIFYSGYFIPFLEWSPLVIFLGASFLTVIGMGAVTSAYYFLIRPKKQAEYSMLKDIPADALRDSQVLTGEEMKKLKSGDETRNAFVLKANKQTRVKLKRYVPKVKFAIAASQNIFSYKTDTELKVYLQSSQVNKDLVFTQKINPNKTLLSRNWLDVSVELDEKYKNLPTVELLFELSSQEIYVSEVRAVSEDKPRKVLLVYFDALRPDHLGCYGYDKSISPCIDAFSEDAVRFSSAFTQGNWTLTSFMSTMTSLYPSQHRVYHPRKESVLANDVPTLAETLRQEGFFTQSFFTHKRLVPNYGFAKGFDSLFQKQCDKKKNQGTADDITLRAIDTLEHHKEGDLFLTLHYFDMHEPYLSASPYAGEFDPKYAQLPITKGEQVKQSKDKEAALGNLKANFDSEIKRTDLRFGLLIDYLKRTNQYEDALILVVADHGTRFHNPDELNKYTLFDESIKVPFILKLPNQPEETKGSFREDVFVSANLDIAPTFYDALSIYQEGNPQGKSLISEESPEKNFVISESLYHGVYSVSVRDKEYRYILHQKFDMTNIKKLKLHNYKEELFGIENDFDQTGEIAKTEKEKCEYYREIAIAHINDVLQKSPKNSKKPTLV